MKNQIWAILLLAVAVSGPAYIQTAEDIAAKQTALEERSRESVAILQALIDSRTTLPKLSARAEPTNEADKEQVLAELEEIEDQGYREGVGAVFGRAGD
ncbi:MAG: hypothetical protein AAF557_06790 [Pseudomonadota bacterium]